MWAAIWNNADAWIAVGVTALVFVGLQMRRRLPVDLMFIGALVAVTVTGVITPAQALKNFSNPAVVTIAGLLIVAAGLKATGVLDWLGQMLLGNVKDERTALMRLGVVLVSTSAFVLNTALVAMTVPVVVDWCRRRNISPSRLLIPVSYFTILGGVCSLIGTSTTLIVNGMLRQQHADAQVVMQLDEQPDEYSVEWDRLTEDRERYEEFVESAKPLGLFEIGKVGVPVAIFGAIVLMYCAPKLLPDRSDLAEEFDEHRREYVVEMRVSPTCRLVDSTVEAAGLRSLEGLFLIEISRQNEVITPVTPNDKLRAGDRLVFTGVVGQIMDLEKIPGLEPVDASSTSSSTSSTKMVEAVLSRTSPLIGQTIRDSNFRQSYDAAVIAVHRNGARLPSKIGDIRLESGDTLLLQTRSDFMRKYRNSVQFYLVSDVDGYQPPKHRQAIYAGLLGLLLIASLIVCSLQSVQDRVPLLRYSEAPAILAVAFACMMIITRSVSVSVARSSLDMQVLLAIVGALGLGEALWVSGAASGIASVLVAMVGNNPYLLLIVVYLIAMFFTELVTNNAVASILLPIAISIAWKGGYNPQPFIMAVAIAASLSFLTPVGYQTNLMVLGPGGYVPRDYLKIGAPVAATVTISSLILITFIWPF